MDLDSVAGELYELPPEEFTSARDARASEVRSAGDRELAAAIKKLRRPTTGAWLANMLVRKRPEQVAELLSLGDAMRQAQAELAGSDLRRLSQRRRQAVAALGDEARHLVRDLGRPLGEASARELEATLQAAIADPAAAGELRRGRLTAALRHSGLGPAGLAGSAAVPAHGEPPADAEPPATVAPLATAEPSATGGPLVTGEQSRDDPRSRERIQAAQRELRAAESAAAAAEREAAKHERRLRGAQAERDRLRRQAAHLERRLHELRDAEQQAARGLLDAGEAHRAAGRKLRDSRERAERARATLDQLTPPDA